MYYPTPEYLRCAFNKTEKTLAAASGEPGSINISDIATKLIQYTGRYVDNYASDLLITYEHVRAFAEKHEITDGEDAVIGFGLRENGVDHNSYIMNRLTETVKVNSGIFMMQYPSVEHIYRKILAVHVSCTRPDPYPKCTIVLKDITHSLMKMSEEDMAWNPDVQVEKWKKEHPAYADRKYNHYAVDDRIWQMAVKKEDR